MEQKVNPQWETRSSEEAEVITKEGRKVAKYIISASPAETKEDKVNHPSHYTWLKKLCGIEVIDITRHMCFNLGNVVKYVLRAGHKSEEGYSNSEKEIEDLQKAKWYLEDEIKLRFGKDTSDKEIIKNLNAKIAELEAKNYKLAEALYHDGSVKIGKFALSKLELKTAMDIINNPEYEETSEIIYFDQAHCGGIGVGTNLILTKVSPEGKIGETITKDITDYSCW